jgi:hypothetical protein
MYLLPGIGIAASGCLITHLLIVNGRRAMFILLLFPWLLTISSHTELAFTTAIVSINVVRRQTVYVYFSIINVYPVIMLTCFFIASHKYFFNQ